MSRIRQREREAQEPSIIVVEPGDTKRWSPHRHKLSMAENMMVDVIVKGKKDKPRKPLSLKMLLQCSFFILKELISQKRFHDIDSFLFH